MKLTKEQIALRKIYNLLEPKLNSGKYNSDESKITQICADALRDTVGLG